MCFDNTLMDIHKKIEKMIHSIQHKDQALEQLRLIFLELQQKQKTEWMKK